MKGIRSWRDRRKTQTFVHMATYRFHEIFPAGLAGRTRDDLVGCILSAVEEACAHHGWRFVAWDVFPERVEVLLTGEETRGESGEGVAAALDRRVHAAAGARVAAH
jgi:hypothetical protein